MIVNSNKQSGFAMMEVLIALVVILFGILGAAGIQMNAINNANIAKQKSMAAMVVSSLVSRMQSNSKYWAINSNNITGLEGVESEPANTCITLCTPTALANLDLNYFKYDLFNAGLRNATASVSYVTGSVPAIYSITLIWDVKEVDGESENKIIKLNYTTSAVLYAGI